jgi:DNA-binding beta-propeller fold protein YncE
MLDVSSLPALLSAAPGSPRHGPPARRSRTFRFRFVAQWDYTTPDPASKRVYVSHGTEVVVIDSETNQIVGRIADTPGVHGIVVGAGKVFVSAGRENRVVVADPKTLATLVKIDSGGANPDAITFDQTSGHVWVFNHTGISATRSTPPRRRRHDPLCSTAEADRPTRPGVFVNIEDRTRSTSSIARPGR